MRVERRAVVVTGASAGIGRATARLLACRGARVLAVARSGRALAELAAEQPGVVPLVADLATGAGRAAVAATELGATADALVNNAGVGWQGRVEEMGEDDVRRLVEVNLVAAVDLTRRLLPGMLQRRCGHVVNVASVSSWVATPPLVVYAATKFGLEGFSDGLRRELAGRGVTVGTVNPGPVRTAFGSRMRAGDRPSEDLPDSPWYGVPPEWVARAVARSIRLGGLPGYTAIAVPRAVGLARLGALPGARLVVDAGWRAVRGLLPSK